MPLSLEELKAKIARDQEQRLRNNIQVQQSQFSNVPPEVIEEALKQEHQISRRASVLGTTFSLGTELGFGMYSSKKIYDAYKAGKIVNWANKVKNLSLLSQAGPQAAEPVSTATALILAGIGQGIAWGGSNFLGQQIRKGYGLQDGISYGELLATGVFGSLTGPSSKLGELANKTFMSAPNRKLLELTGKTAGDMGAYKKGGYIFINGVKSFIGGASFGIAETAVRQELQIALNERDTRDTYEYLFAGGIGGTANTILGAFAKAGSWGRSEQIRITENADKRLSKDIAALKAEIKEIEKTGKTGLFGRTLSKKKKQLQSTEEAQRLLKTAVDEYNVQNAKIKELEDGKTKETYNDEVETKVEVPKNIDDKNVDEILPELKQFENERIYLQEVQTANSLKAKKRRGEEIDPEQEALIQRVDRLQDNNTAIPTTDLPVLVRRVTQTSDEIEDEINNTLARILKKEASGEIEASDYKRLKFLYNNKEFLHNTVLDEKLTEYARGLQQRQQRAANLGKNYINNILSVPTQTRKAAYKELVKAIDDKLENFSSDAINIKTLRNTLNKLNKDLDAIKRANASLGKASKKIKRKPEITKIAKKDSKAAIQKLEKQLEDLRKGDVDLGQPLRRVAKDVAKEEQILKDKIKFYRTSQKELVELEKLQKELDDLIKMSPDEFKKLDAKERAKRELLRKDKIKTKNDQVKEKIASIKKGLRSATKDLPKDKKPNLDAEFYSSVEKYYFETLNNGFGGKIKRFLNTATSWRQAALIDQLSSVVAGIPTGAYGIAKQFVKPHTNLVSNLLSKERRGLAFKLYVSNLSASAAFIHGLKDALRAGFLSAKRFESVTDPRNASKLREIRGVRVGTANSLRQAKIRAERQVRAQNNVLSFIDKNLVTGNLWNLLSLGLRGIIGVDEVMRRQLIKTRITANARQKAVLQNAKDPSKSVKEIEENLLNIAWKKNADGLDVLQETEEFITEVNFGREELFYAASKDDIGDVHYSIVNKFLDHINKVSKNEYTNFAFKIFFPFVDVVVRSVYRGGRLVALGSGGGIARAKILNPYAKKIKDLNAQKKAINEKPFDPKEFSGTEAQYQARVLKESKDINERISKLEVRRVEYNEEILADSVMGATLMYLGYQLAQLNDEDGVPLITGSMSYLSFEQRKKFEERGIKPYTIFGLPYEAMVPFSLPMAFAADLSYWTRLKDPDEEGSLETDQNFFNVAFTAIRSLGEELPFNQGVKLASDLLFSDPSQESSAGKVEKAATQLLSSYTPYPAQLRKLTKIATGEGKIADLKGGTFLDRYHYMTFGIHPGNKKVNLFGEDIKSSENLVQSLFRFTPDAKEEITAFDEIIANDFLNEMPTEIKKDLITGVKMKDYLNEEGITLYYEFAKRLRKTRVKKDIERLIKNKSWRKRKFRDGKTVITNGGIETNEGIVELENILRSYWSKVTDDILKEKKNFLQSFINKDEETLYDVLKEKRSRVYGTKISRDIIPLQISN